MSSELEIRKLNKLWIEYVHSVATYQNYLTRLGEMTIFLAKARKFSILPTSLDSFDIRQNYVCILYLP